MEKNKKIVRDLEKNILENLQKDDSKINIIY